MARLARRSYCRFGIAPLLLVMLAGCGFAPLAVRTLPFAPSTSTHRIMPPTHCLPPSTTPQSLLSLGDSYTIGEGVAETERWSVILQKLLTEHGWQIQPPTIVARTGWTTDELANAIQSAELTEHYDWVTLLIGVNNQYRGYPLDNYQLEFSQLLQSALQFTGGNAKRVVVLSIPDWSVTPFAMQAGRTADGEQIAKFNEINRMVSEQAGVLYIDITPTSQQGVWADPSTALAPDQLHYSGAMHREWALLALEGICQSLQAGKP
ncbi:MAG TPA: GDSL-type esterase/lipase family protein [Anaerolineales bacterium]|nr:GDSL-type esterase/lipase family protein [Anaerolineales bacterium]